LVSGSLGLACALLMAFNDLQAFPNLEVAIHSACAYVILESAILLKNIKPFDIHDLLDVPCIYDPHQLEIFKQAHLIV